MKESTEKESQQVNPFAEAQRVAKPEKQTELIWVLLRRNPAFKWSRRNAAIRMDWGALASCGLSLLSRRRLSQSNFFRDK
ncbi:MAG: hypothetical protein HY298_26160 [Verrucomicrobia bacterium]|nr:hypothetical protein [Verrucomicrobiota bacterium]